MIIFGTLLMFCKWKNNRDGLVHPIKFYMQSYSNRMFAFYRNKQCFHDWKTETFLTKKSTRLICNEDDWLMFLKSINYVIIVFVKKSLSVNNLILYSIQQSYFIWNYYVSKPLSSHKSTNNYNSCTKFHVTKLFHIAKGEIRH